MWSAPKIMEPITGGRAIITPGAAGDARAQLRQAHALVASLNAKQPLRGRWQVAAERVVDK